mmetsp:Transcript_30773/g.45528  ORF Transcript_30773/g.45528 Transcript_30773/m.45528 type:complete len:521 (+) Transcript_30773:133-1695(+)
MMRPITPIPYIFILLLLSVTTDRCLGRTTTPLVAARFLRAPTAIRKRGSNWKCSTSRKVNVEKNSVSNGNLRHDLESYKALDESNSVITSPEEASFSQKGTHAFFRRVRSSCATFTETQRARVTSFATKPKIMARTQHFDEMDTVEDTSSSSQTPLEKGASLKLQGGAASAALTARPLVFWENMVCGAISRSVAQTVMHPANTMKTMLQSRLQTETLTSLMSPKNFHRLTVGAGANFVLSVPHGAVNFAVLEFVRSKLAQLLPAEANGKLGPGLDFVSSCISTVCCSVVSTPQMMVTDNIMAGNYPNLPSAMKGLFQDRGIAGFYSGWFPGLVGKIPSYALTWTFFQQLKDTHARTFKRPAKDIENSIMGCVASATTVCIMIPLDTIKTRLVTQVTGPSTADAYKGIIDCAFRVYREEGIRTFYRGLAPRLISVVPMIGIQFGVYEFMKKVMRERSISKTEEKRLLQLKGGPEDSHKEAEEVFEEDCFETAVGISEPFPSHKFRQQIEQQGRKKKKKKVH